MLTPGAVICSVSAVRSLREHFKDTPIFARALDSLHAAELRTAGGYSPLAASEFQQTDNSSLSLSLHNKSAAYTTCNIVISEQTRREHSTQSVTGADPSSAGRKGLARQHLQHKGHGAGAATAETVIK